MKARLGKGAMWLSVSRAATNLIAFLSTLLLARLLAPTDFGLVALATTMLAIISSVTDLSLAQALVHHANPTEEHFDTAWSLNAARGVTIGILFCAFAYPASLAFHEPRLVMIMVALGGTVVLNGMANPKMVVFARNLVFKQDFALNVSSKLAGFVAAITVAVVFRSYWALVVGSIVTQVTNIIVSYWILPYRPRPTMKHAGDLWSFSIWLTCSQIVTTLNTRFDQLLIGGLLGRAPLGYYTFGDNLASTPTRETTAPLAQTLFPAFARLRDQPGRLRDAYTSAQTLISAIALPIAFGVALVAEPLVRLTVNDKWMPAVIVIQVLASIFGLQTLSSAVQPLALAKGQTRQLFGRDVLFFVIRLPTIAIGLYLGGLHGIIYARALTGSISIFINMRLVTQMIGIPVRSQIASNGRSVASAAVMALAVWLVERATGTHGTSLELIKILALLLLTGICVYGGTSYLLWRIAGRPAGPEREVGKLILKLRHRFQHKPA